MTPVPANAHFKRALDLDPSLGIARVLYAMTAAGMSGADREAEMQRGVADAAKASPNELLTAMAYREQARGEGAAANNLFRAAAAAMPREPTVAYRRALTVAALPNRDQADRLIALRAVTNAFPEYAPVRNTYAYALWNMGNEAEALRQVQEYMRLLPTHPNSHDSYAELAQWDGRFDEAIAHYRKAASLDASYQVAHDGIAEVQILMGRSDLARATITAAAATGWPNDAGGHRRLAATHVIDGNAKAAITELGLAVDAAKAAGNAGLESFLHIQAALVDLNLGTGKEAQRHLAAAGTGNQGMAPLVKTLDAYARRDWAAAHATVQGAIRDANTAGNTNLAGNLEVTDAMVYVGEGRPDDAMAALVRGNQGAPNGRMVMAQAAMSRGDAGTARAIGEEILGNRQLALLNVNDALARGVARRIVAGGNRK